MERKIAAGGGLGIPLAVIVSWAWNATMTDMLMPAEVSAALGAVITMAVGWAVPNPK